MQTTDTLGQTSTEGAACAPGPHLIGGGDGG